MTHATTHNCPTPSPTVAAERPVVIHLPATGWQTPAQTAATATAAICYCCCSFASSTYQFEYGYRNNVDYFCCHCDHGCYYYSQLSRSNINNFE